jgi:hypothetical protein
MKAISAHHLTEPEGDMTTNRMIWGVQSDGVIPTDINDCLNEKRGMPRRTPPKSDLFVAYPFAPPF